jgi:hypothetical protein
MLLALLTLISGLAISAVAIYYSVLGLASIFAAAVIPIVVMGTILEVSKLVAAWWLKSNWHRAPFLLKSYLLVAVIVLMFITSMGIFGFLSSAHSDQTLVSGDVSSQIELYDEQIKNERDNIENARTLIKQLDDAVIGIQSGEGREIRNRDGTTRIENPAERALAVRRSQSRDRANLSAQIEASQKAIQAIQEKRAPIAADLRKVEAEVGPIKYIAKLIYGDSTDNDLLEKAVTWVIILIVAVFDPLAVLLLLASQLSFQWYRQDKENQDRLLKESLDNLKTQPEPKLDNLEIVKESPVENPVTTVVEELKPTIDPHPVGWMYAAQPVAAPLPAQVDEIPAINIHDVERPGDYLSTTEDVVTDDSILDEVPDDVRAAMSQWKADHPNDSLKHQRSLFQRGIVKKLPWDDYLPPVDEEHEAAVEAAKWAQEQLDKNDTSKKKDNNVDGESREQTGQENQGRVSDGYIQNAEQSKSTLWQRVKGIKK